MFVFKAQFCLMGGRGEGGGLLLRYAVKNLWQTGHENAAGDRTFHFTSSLFLHHSSVAKRLSPLGWFTKGTNVLTWTFFWWWPVLVETCRRFIKQY
jgi:hypothetical protein